MRFVVAAALFAALSGQSLAQQARQPAPAPRAGTPAPGPTQAAPAPGSAGAASASNPQIFPCRTPQEVCFLGIVTGPSQVSILFTNAPGGDSMEPKPLDVATGEGAGTPLDLSANLGRVVMLTGTFDPKAGLTKAEVVEVASPLISALIKLQAGSEEEEEPAPAAGAKAKPGAAGPSAPAGATGGKR
jgi:hypothetical protein